MSWWHGINDAYDLSLLLIGACALAWPLYLAACAIWRPQTQECILRLLQSLSRDDKLPIGDNALVIEQVVTWPNLPERGRQKYKIAIYLEE